MKKKICAILLCASVIISSLWGCGSESSNDNIISENDEANINKIQKIVKEIDGYTDKLKENLKSLEEDNFGENTADLLSDMMKKSEIINKYCDEAKKMQMESDEKAIIDTYSVFVKYLGELSELYENVLAVDDFFVEVAKIDNERDDLWNSYSDEIDKVKNIYLKWEDFMDEYHNVECPDFMQDTYDLYVESFEQTQALYYEWYCALELQDPLRINAVSNTIDFTNEKIDRYTDELLNDVKKQYDQSEKLINDRIDVYEQELMDNCEKILDSVATEKE